MNAPSQEAHGFGCSDFILDLSAFFNWLGWCVERVMLLEGHLTDNLSQIKMQITTRFDTDYLVIEKGCQRTKCLNCMKNNIQSQLSLFLTSVEKAFLSLCSIRLRHISHVHYHNSFLPYVLYLCPYYSVSCLTWCEAVINFFMA